MRIEISLIIAISWIISLKLLSVSLRASPGVWVTKHPKALGRMPAFKVELQKRQSRALLLRQFQPFALFEHPLGSCVFHCTARFQIRSPQSFESLKCTRDFFLFFVG
ncbi:hypothetical protein CDAR_494121 [Caerostris darwini]|uniref:Secreted protein n=1 Tax=Caerostris darwini TaxID=1538125 RepID=A0AAV4NV31_9ARAC|nr:hypothetical protein CDAR_494121 [Caerostris darwini]